MCTGSVFWSICMYLYQHESSAEKTALELVLEDDHSS